MLILLCYDSSHVSHDCLGSLNLQQTSNLTRLGFFLKAVRYALDPLSDWCLVPNASSLIYNAISFSVDVSIRVQESCQLLLLLAPNTEHIIPFCINCFVGSSNHVFL